MLTARGDPVDRVLGLELGADDYVAKPFDARELVARVRAVWRRVAPAEPDLDAGSTRPRLGEAVLDLRARTLCVGERQVPLTTIEFRLLVELATHPGVALSRELLNKAAQVGNYRPLERAVDVQIARLRRKLGRSIRTPPGSSPRAAKATSGRHPQPRIAGASIREVASAADVRPHLHRPAGDDHRALILIAATFSDYQNRVTALTLAPMWAAALGRQERPVRRAASSICACAFTCAPVRHRRRPIQLRRIAARWRWLTSSRNPASS